MFFYTYLSISPKFLMTLNVWSTNESVCLTEPLRVRCLPNMNRPRSPFWCRPNMFGTSSPFWHSLQWNAPMKKRRRNTTGGTNEMYAKQTKLIIIIVAIIVYIMYSTVGWETRSHGTATFFYLRALAHGLNQSQNMITVGMV